MKKSDGPTVFVEVYISIDGSAIKNRLTTFEMPIVEKNQSDLTDSSIKFESKTLIKEMKKALDKLV